MDQAILVAFGATATLLLGLLVLLAALWAGHRRDHRELAAARDEVERLRARVEDITSTSGGAESAGHPDPGGTAQEFVITNLTGDNAAAAGSDAGSTRLVLSASLADPLVKALAFGYGVRRALSPENRNRIAFEMRREVKRARKQRRRSTRLARREAHAAQRAAMVEEPA